MRKKIVAGNWKMNNTVPESLKLLAAIQHNLKTVPDDVDVVLIPPFTALYSVWISMQETPLRLGAQDLFWEDNGAYTGEVSAPFLKDVGCSFVVIGHSERRQFFGETNAAVNKKIFAALRSELKPIVCVGESLADREAGRHAEVVGKQIKEAFLELHARDAENVVVAYEPIWAIGTGKTATPELAQEMHHSIRNLIEKLFDAPTASKVRILYGGSVKADNATALFSQKGIDGALVGGASLKGAEFAEIVRAVPPVTES